MEWEIYIDHSFDVPEGIVRWESNHNIPFDDKLKEFYDIGVITEEQVIASKKQREIETATFIEEYKERMKDWVPSAEELYEMRAAFGTEVTLVDVISGTKFTI